MASTSDDDDDLITVVCTNPNASSTTQAFISLTDLQSCNPPSLLTYRSLQLKPHRNSLVQHSSYFRKLLTGSFSESEMGCIEIKWNVETFVDIMKCIYGCELDVTFDNFLSLIEGALYFGVEMLIARCQAWFSEVASSDFPPEMKLEDLIYIWSFGLDHACDFLRELCASYLARNFMWAIPMNNFEDIPYELLLSCVKNINLTVDSEMHLADSLILWLKANTARMEGLKGNEDDCTCILKQIRTTLLPLWFSAVKRSSCHFSKLADESINSIFRLLKIPSSGLINALGDSHLPDLTIRLTKFSKKVNISSCPQITSVMILMSVLPSSHNNGSTVRNIEQLMEKFDRLGRDQCSFSLRSLPVLSFEQVQEVDISKCPKLQLESAIECFCTSFPSLRILKAAFLLNFDLKILCHLLRKCPRVYEVNLTTDTSPIIASHVYTLSSGPATAPQRSNVSLYVRENPLYVSPFNKIGLSLAKLNLEGRNDLSDSDVQYVSEFLVSLQYLNIRGCISLTDVGIASLLLKCRKLHSVLVCDTYFGVNSVLALCSSRPDYIAGKHIENKHLEPVACNLQALHMGGCKCVEEASLIKIMSQTQKLKTLCLRDTNLDDAAVYKFGGSSLEVLDISDTKVSEAALVHLVVKNQGLKSLKLRGCRYLSQQQCDSQKGESLSVYSCKQLINIIGKILVLEEIAFGWGFSYSSLDALKPAISSLRKLTVGLGGSLGQDSLERLPNICPMLESIVLYFQVLSDSIVMEIMENLKDLLVLALCYCMGDISILSFKHCVPNLRKLKLERVTPWMTNSDLSVLTTSCANLIELSLQGCTLLNSESQQIISNGWPGLVSIHLEECGDMTIKGVSSLLDCSALEDLLLRHNGPGIKKSFISDAASKLPLLRKVSLDLCDASEGEFEIPDYDDRYFLTTLKIARCKSQRHGLEVQLVQARRRPVHKETLVVVWNSKTVVRTVVKERL